MEDRGGEHGGSVTLAHAVDQIVEAADAARGDHRHAARVGDRAGERVVEALARAVAIDSRQPDLARTQFYQAFRPPDRLAPAFALASWGEYLPSPRVDLPGVACPTTRTP